MEEAPRRERRMHALLERQLEHAEELQLDAGRDFGGAWDPAWNRALVERLMDVDEEALTLLVTTHPELQQHREAVEQGRRELEKKCRGFEATLESVPLKALAVAGKRPKCPFCSGGMQVSFVAHVRSCPALYELGEDEGEKQNPGDLQIPSLVDLCVATIKDHILLLFDNHTKLSREAAITSMLGNLDPDSVIGTVLAVMPPHVVHRLADSLLNTSSMLLKERHKIIASTRKQREMLHETRIHTKAMGDSAGSLDELFSALRLFYHQTPDHLQAAASLAENDAKIAKSHCTRSKRQLDALQQKAAFMESKINSLSMEKEATQKALEEAKEQEAQATRTLSQSRRGIRNGRRPQAVAFEGKRPAPTRADTRSLPPVVRARSSSTASMIPLPSTLSPEYRSMITDARIPGTPASGA